MDVLVSGSMAYDRIMDFSGMFSDHFLADRLENINVSFTVNGLEEKFGGTAGNIAYCLSLLGETPRILATIGHDYHRYFEWLDKCGVSTDGIKIVPQEATASAYITTDSAGNQITGFNPGAMKYPSGHDLSDLDSAETIAIVGPGNLDDMAEYMRAYQEKGVFAVFDPGQSLPAWDGEELARSISRAKMMVSNEYEMGLITNSTGLSVVRMLRSLNVIVTTKGDRGADIITRRSMVTVPAIPTENAVDPTGAGDAFRGGLLVGLIRGLQIRRAVEMGTVCAHYAVQTYGTQEYSFTPEEFTEKLELHFGREDEGEGRG